jgi:hypothetical protein
LGVFPQGSDSSTVAMIRNLCVNSSLRKEEWIIVQFSQQLHKVLLTRYSSRI